MRVIHPEVGGSDGLVTDQIQTRGSDMNAADKRWTSEPKEKCAACGEFRFMDFWDGSGWGCVGCAETQAEKDWEAYERHIDALFYTIKGEEVKP